jgi:hypothetical protein
VEEGRVPRRSVGVLQSLLKNLEKPRMNLLKMVMN